MSALRCRRLASSFRRDESLFPRRRFGRVTARANPVLRIGFLPYRRCSSRHAVSFAFRTQTFTSDHERDSAHTFLIKVRRAAEPRRRRARRSLRFRRRRVSWARANILEFDPHTYVARYLFFSRILRRTIRRKALYLVCSRENARFADCPSHDARGYCTSLNVRAEMRNVGACQALAFSR